MPPFASYAMTWDDAYPFTAPVGKFQRNKFRLYDMHGNVGEWCRDWYDPDFYKSADATKPDPMRGDPGPEIDISGVIPGAPKRTLRMIRGGVWLDPVTGLRSADRKTHLRHPIDAAADIGFRVVAEE
jgi:formylglycine-generating enzyme required for sulfatase activity